MQQYSTQMIWDKSDNECNQWSMYIFKDKIQVVVYIAALHLNRIAESYARTAMGLGTNYILVIQLVH